MFIWLTTWSVIDAILHTAGVAQAVSASKQFEAVGSGYGLGTLFFTLLPSFTSKVAAAFGAIRWSGLMLSSIVTTMLIRFGGTALAMLAGQISSAPQASGAGAGQAILKDVTSPVRADIVPQQTWANAAVVAGGVGNLIKGLQEIGAGEMAGRARAGAALGAAKIAQSVATTEVERIARGARLYSHHGGLEGAIGRGIISADTYGGEFEKGLPEQLRVFSLASGRPTNFTELGGAKAQGMTVVSYGNDKGYVRLGSGATVFVNGSEKFALLDPNSPVNYSIREGTAYRATLQGLLSNRVAQKFMKNLQNKWFDSSSGEYRDEVGEGFRNTFSQNFVERIASSESLSKKLGLKKDEQALWKVRGEGGIHGKAGLSLDGPGLTVNVNFETGVATMYDKTTGIETTKQLNKDELNEIKTAYDYATHKGWSYVISNKSGYEYVLTKAKDDSAETAKVFQQAFENARDYAKSLGLNFTNAMFHQYVVGKYGTVNLDTVAAADADFKRMSATGDFNELWKYVEKPSVGVDPEKVTEKINQIVEEVNKEKEKLNFPLVNPSGDPSSVKPANIPEVKGPDYNFVRQKAEKVKKLIKNFEKEHENVGPLGLGIKDITNTISNPPFSILGFGNLVNNYNPLNPMNRKYQW